MVVGLSSSSLHFFLLLCSPLFLFFQCFFFCFSQCRPVLINDGEDGGAGGGYADCSQWFFLLSLLHCFHFQDLTMALVVLLLFFLSVCVASVNNVLLSLPWLCCWQLTVLVAIGELGELLGWWFSFPSQRCPLFLAFFVPFYLSSKSSSPPPVCFPSLFGSVSSLSVTALLLSSSLLLFLFSSVLPELHSSQKQTLPSVFYSPPTVFCSSLLLQNFAPLNLSLTSLLLQNFCHHQFVLLPSIYKQEKREPPCSVPSWCRGEAGYLTSTG